MPPLAASFNDTGKQLEGAGAFFGTGSVTADEARDDPVT
jgi:hypothetical protein